ncbi:MAG: PH domain-containing protein [Xanthomonadales bacterium]|jgi:hypothetical protein|nr:PH domain-containing protein [Xanthomonadales bacterium]
MKSETFPSRIDAWLVAVTGAAVGLLLWQALNHVPEEPEKALTSLGVIGLMAVIGALFAYPCTYTLTDTQLLIRSGWVRQRIAYQDITGVAPSAALWSAPALSLQRVRIDFAGRFQLVSPRERERFIAALRERVAAARA